MKQRSNGVELYYEVNGQGPWLTLIHASADNSQVWFNQVPVFSREYRVLTFDIRGFGRSEIPQTGYAIQTYAEDLYELLCALGATASYALGHSMGGAVARWLAAEHPEIVPALIMANSGAGRTSAPGWVQTSLALAELVEREGMSAVTGRRMERLFAAGFVQSRPEAVERYRQVRLQNNPLGYLRSLRASRDHAKTPPLEAVRCPTLLIVGDQDPLVTVEQMRDLCGQMGDARLVVLEDCGHVSPIEQPEAFSNAVLDFLREVQTRHGPS